MQDPIQAPPGHPPAGALPDLTVGVMFNDATPLIKLIMVLLLIAAAAAVAVAVRKALTRDGSPSAFVSNLRLAGPLLGLFGTAYGVMNSMIGVVKTTTTNIAVIAPGVAEGALSAALGLLAGAVACAANWAIEARRQGPPAAEPGARRSGVLAPQP